MFLMKGLSSVLLFVLGRRQNYHDETCCHRARLVTNHNVASPFSTTTTTMMTSSTAQTTTIEICLSPGCIADGANEALLKLQALSASSSSSTTTTTTTTTTTKTTTVVPGVCCSLCGNGPVAKETAESTGRFKSHRKLNTNQKLLDLLSLGEESDLDPNQRAVLEGIDLCLAGDRLLQKKKYADALEKYRLGIDKGMDAAMELAGHRNDNNNDSNNDSNNDNNNDNDGTTAALQWLVKALCNEASAKLQTKDVDGAVSSAEKALELSKPSSSSSSSSVEALEVLQAAYQTRGSKNDDDDDDRNELEVLEALFALYEAEDQKPAKKKKRITPMEANRRRTLGFRLTRLQASVPRDS